MRLIAQREGGEDVNAFAPSLRNRSGSAVGEYLPRPYLGSSQTPILRRSLLRRFAKQIDGGTVAQRRSKAGSIRRKIRAREFFESVSGFSSSKGCVKFSPALFFEIR